MVVLMATTASSLPIVLPSIPLWTVWVIRWFVLRQWLSGQTQNTYSRIYTFSRVGKCHRVRDNENYVCYQEEQYTYLLRIVLCHQG